MRQLAFARFETRAALESGADVIFLRRQLPATRRSPFCQPQGRRIFLGCSRRSLLCMCFLSGMHVLFT